MSHGTPLYVFPRFVIDREHEPYASFSTDAATDIAVVFVHGFGGKATDTWGRFRRMVDDYSNEYPWWSKADLFFYAYKSTDVPIRYNASRLARFVEDLWRGNWTPKAGARSDPHYKDLILVGHSEGGVLVRRMILDRFETTVREAKQASNAGAEVTRPLTDTLHSDFILSAYVRLFAPAISGTNFSSTLGFFDRSFPGLAGTRLVRNELDPESPILTSLRAGTEKAREEFPSLRSLYTRPLFGIPDRVVFSEAYQGELPLWEEDSSHTGICKPTYRYKRPLEFVSKTSEAGQ